MPGHKRKNDEITGISKCILTGKLDGMHRHRAFRAVHCAYKAQETDITEITGYDNLHHPEGMIRESMDNLKKIYHTKESWYLVNGSTVGILASVSAVCRPGDKIIVGRNCHKAVYNAIRLLRLHAIYLYPAQNEKYDIMLDVGKAEREQLKEILKKEAGVKAVVLTSPTYEGVVSDIAAVRKVLSEQTNGKEIVLIIDEAHGAHLLFHDAFPKSAVECGADIVVQSTHKTLPALTQTALLHLCSDRIPEDVISDWLSVYETSSPSYILMASAESGVIFMHSQGKKVQKYVDNLTAFRRKCGQLMHIHLIEGKELAVFDYDIGKLVFYVDGKKNGGRWLFAMLRDEWNIELELESTSYVIGMTSVMDEKKDFEMLWEALAAADRELKMEYQDRRKARRTSRTEMQGKSQMKIPDRTRIIIPEKIIEPWECERDKTIMIPLCESIGRTAASYVMLYPPGIPLLAPGEKIIKEIVEKLSYYLYNGYNVQGLRDDMIPVLI